jgi:hypothetical protein
MAQPPPFANDRESQFGFYLAPRRLIRYRPGASENAAGFFHRSQTA